MRSRPQMTVLLRPGTPLPGQTLEVEARLVSESDTPLDAVTFDLLGVEVVRVQRGKSTAVWRHEHVHQRAAVPGRPLTVGEHTYKAMFKLPAELPPSNRGRFATIDYTLEVRADIPWWPDRVGRYDVPIAHGPASAPQKPALFVSEPGGARAGEIYAEMSLASSVFEPGNVIVGTVAFTNIGKEKDVRIALVAAERLFADGTFFEGGSIRETFDVQRWAYAIAKGPLEDGRAYPFRFAIAPDTVPTFTGSISAFEWALEVTIEGLFSRKVLLHAPIRIVPRAGAPRPAPELVPAIGLERRFQSFQNVGARLGLSFDAQHGELRGTTADVGIRIGGETRPDGTLVTVAHLSWPSLGMGLRVEASSWTDHLSTREIDVGHEAFDQRFHVRSRFTPQAAALFDEALCALLMSFQEVEVDDDGATLAVPISLVDEVPLADFVARASQTARAFAAGIARVPPPEPLGATVPAWNDFAARIGGRFEIASGSVRDATLGQERVEIATAWSDTGEPRGTSVHVALGTRIDAQAISPAARSQIEAIEKESGGHVDVADDRITLSLGRLVTDPLTLDPLLDVLARLAQTVRGRGGAGPFRS